MENRIFGILTITVVSILFWISYRKSKTEQYEFSILLIVLGGFLLRLFASCDFFLHPWDERFHALVAKNLIDNPFKPMLYKVPLLDYDYKSWASNHIWVHKQPFPLYSMALSMWTFGKNEIALRLPSIVLSTAAIFTTYKIGSILSSKKIGLLAAFLFAINGLIIEQTAGRVATDHVDSIFISLVCIAVYFLLRNVKNKNRTSLIIGAIVTGLAILTKWLPALIVIPVWLIYSVKRKSIKLVFIDGLIFFLVLLVIAAPWQWYILSEFPREAAWEYGYNKLHFFQVLGPHAQPIYFHFDRMRIIFGELAYLPFIWLIYHSFKFRFNNSHGLLLAWIIIPYLFFTIAQTKMQGYILFCAPAMFLMISMFYEYIQQFKTKYFIAVRIVSLLLIALPIRYSFERIKPFNNADRNPEWISELKQIATEDKSAKKVIFNIEQPIEAMFYTDMIAYETIPNITKLKHLNSEGYSIYISDFKKISTEISKLDFLKFIK